MLNMTVGRLVLVLVFAVTLVGVHAGSLSAGLLSPSTPGLLRLLYLDGDAEDATGTENGVIAGDPTFPGTGCVDNACFEANGNDAVTFPTLFDTVPASWTIEVWVKLHEFPASDCAVITGKRQGGAFIEHYIGYTSVCAGEEKFRFFSWAGVEHTAIVIIASDPIVLGEWYLLTFTFDGTTYQGYVNGQPVGSQAGPPIPDGTAHDFRIGGRDAGPIDLFMVGRIDEFAAYDRALSSAEVQAHYVAGTLDPGALPSLITQVQAVSQLTSGQRNALIAKLEAAGAAITRGAATTACNQLNAFTNEVGALGDKLGTATAASLIDQAQVIRGVLGCS